MFDDEEEEDPSVFSNPCPRHQVLDIYVFDWLGAAALVGSKVCYPIIHGTYIAPSVLQRSQQYFAHTYLGLSRHAVQNLG